MAEVSREEYNKDIKRLDIKNGEQDKKLEELMKDTCQLKSSLRDLFAMPERITAIEKTQIETNMYVKQISEKLENTSEHNEKQDAEIKGFKEVGTINWIKLVSDNAWKILLAVASLCVAGEQIMLIINAYLL